MRKISIYSLTLLIIASFVSSCTTRVDQDLLGRADCLPPCWMGISPGKTEEEVVQELMKKESEGDGKFTIFGNSIIRWQDNAGKNYYLHVDDNVISRIEFLVSKGSLKDIIQLFGYPSNFALGEIREGHYELLVFYPMKGLVFLASGHENNKIVIRPEMPITKAYFLSPADITTVTKSLYGDAKSSEFLSTVQEWNGYKQISP